MPHTALEQEITQESRRTLELTSGYPTHFFTEGNMFFYWAAENQWVQTGTPWSPAQRREEAEMDRIVVVALTQFNKNMNDDEIIAGLLRQAGSTGAPSGAGDFTASATRTAFINLIRMYLEGELG